MDETRRSHSTAHTRDELVRLDDAHVWHPFTPHSVYRDESPLMVVAGDGHYLIDAAGRRYLDGVASLWCNLFGHRRAEIDAAIVDQLGRIAHSTFLGNASSPAVALAARLIGLAGTYENGIQAFAGQLASSFVSELRIQTLFLAASSSMWKLCAA